jgi:uncharacterized protein YoxC
MTENEIAQILKGMQSQIESLKKKAEMLDILKDEQKRLDDRLTGVSEKQDRFDTLEEELADVTRDVISVQGSMEEIETWKDNPEIDVGEFEE